MRNFKIIFLYARFSDPNQGKGTSLERQLGDMEAFLAKEGFTGTIQIITDEGRSAYHGVHRTAGEMGRFEAEAARGDYAGCLFLCENLDRFSRQAHEEGRALIKRMTDGGVTVCTLDNDIFEAYRPVTLLAVITSSVKFDLAQKESEKKAARTAANWQIRMEKARLNGTAFSKIGPPWLVIDPATNKWVPNPARSALVLQVFQMADSGMGALTVAKALNDQGVPVWQAGWRKWKKPLNGWQHKTIENLLSDRRVIGEFQPCRMVKRKRVADGEPWQGFFPAVVPANLFERVRADAGWRCVVGNGKNSKESGAPKINNVFSPLTKCVDFR